MAITDFEKRVLDIMIVEDCGFQEALNIIFDSDSVDKSSILSLTDYLEEQVPDLDKVAYFMKIWCGQTNNLKLNFEHYKTANTAHE
ncbi:MAG: hypothetical protein WCY93_11330 [Anaerolineaceae bacterium]